MANDVDRAFVRMTIPHHRQGIEMGTLAAERASEDDVKKKAQETVEDQRSDLAELERMLPALGLSESDVQPPEPVTAAMQQMLEHLGAQPGHMFDASFLAMMMSHHLGAINSAEVELAGGELQELLTLTRSTHEKQLEELSEMRQMLETVSGKGMMNKVKSALA